VRPFTYVRVADEASAVAAGQRPDAGYLAGGTGIVDLLRLGVQAHETLVDVHALPLARIEPEGDGLRIGAMARNSDIAYDPLVQERYPLLSQAILAGASPQVRNMATLGGNLLQRTRCPYFRDPGVPCNKRRPGSGCPAWDGYNRSNAILGGSEHCIAVHPSDLCVALVALDAVVHARGPGGARRIPAKDFHVVPGDHPEIETVLQRGDLVTHVVLPPSPFAARSAYVKVRDRTSFAFALASAAVGLEVQGGVVRTARIALGGVATKPWRALEAEALLVGRRPGPDAFREAAEAAVRGARPREHNAFKVALARRTVARALQLAGGPA
jgi:xanthine dehydrogenase YagS FAD-binding subunit